MTIAMTTKKPKRTTARLFWFVPNAVRQIEQTLSQEWAALRAGVAETGFSLKEEHVVLTGICKKMSEVKKTKVHLISGFLGTGKTTALKSLMAQKDPNEKWVIIVNEFGEIGIDGAVLSDNGIPVAEIAGGCLCCTAGAQMGTTVQKMLRDAQPDRLMIEASGLHTLPALSTN